MGEMVPVDKAKKKFSDLLNSKAMQTQLRLACTKLVPPDKLVRFVLTEVTRNPKLLLCTRDSLLGSVMTAASLGLKPGVLGECWIIPYGDTATFVPGYRGLETLAYRSGFVVSIAAHVVYEGDSFSFDFGMNTISHVPSGEIDPEKITHAWAAIFTQNGGRIWDVMTRAEVDRIRARSRAGEDGPWVTDYAEMAKKTVLRRTLKHAPCSTEMSTALALSEAADAGLTQEFDFDVPSEPEKDVTPAKAASNGAAAATAAQGVA